MNGSCFVVHLRAQPSPARHPITASGCWSAAAALALGLLATLPQSARAADNPEELRLRNGNVLKGQFVEGDKQTIVFRSESGLQSFPKKDVRAIIFELEPAGAAGEFPPGFTAKPPHQLKRVVVTRRITRNRATEEQTYEPEVIGISGDGSKIVFWTRKSGFYAINPDGTGRAQILARKDNSDRFNAEWGGRFEVNRDGKVLYWQGYQAAAIRRINTDGSDERLLVRAGAEYDPFRLREACGRIFFSQRGGIFSIDTEGKGDYREIITHNQLAKLWEISPERCMLGRFDASADGKRIAFAVGGYPKAKAVQLMAINADGTGLRRIIETDFDPTALTMSPDGQRIIFWKYGTAAYVVNWDGSGFRELALPPWDANGSGFQHLNRFSSDDAWYMFNGNESGGFTQISRVDGPERIEPLSCGNWDYFETGLFHGLYSPTFTADLRRFVSISQYWRQFKPRQIVVGDINPRQAPGVPVLSDIEFSGFLATNPQVPQHRGAVKVRVTKADSAVERVQFLLVPVCGHARTDAARWRPNLGWDALQGDHQLRDDGKNGDAVAGDGVYSTDNFSPHTSDFRMPEGRYLLRIVAHDDQNAVAVDVDGVEIK